MNLEDRIAKLQELGCTYDEKSRSFKNGNVKIDIDVVQYGTDQLFEKQLKKLTR